jgi:integrase
MAAKLLTAASVTRIKPDPSRRLEVPDRQQPGLYLVVQPSGRRSYAIRTRISDRPVKITLGDADTLDLAEARQRTANAIKIAKRGDDPRVQRAVERANTVEAVVEEYVERRLKPRLKDWQGVAQRLRRDWVTAYGPRPVSSLTRPDILRQLDRMGDRGLRQGRNRALVTIRPFLGWCLERGLVEHNAALGIKPPAKEIARDRVLEDDEIVAVWRACDGMGFPFGPLLRVMLLTAQREGEVAHMKWSQVDLERRLWTLPAEATKAGRAHEVALSDLAVNVLAALPRLHEGDLVFSTTGISAPSGWSRAKQRLDRLSGVADWRLHDLRRSAASTLARLAHPPHVVAAVLNHTPGSLMGITAVYNRHRYTDEKRAALDAWARHVERLVNGTSAEVVELRRGAQ